MAGTTPDNVDWIRRKRNVVQRFHRSSYAIGLQLAKQQTTLTEQVGVDARDYAAHGGCFPIRLHGTGCIGTITVSGLPQRAVDGGRRQVSRRKALRIQIHPDLAAQPADEGGGGCAGACRNPDT